MSRSNSAGRKVATIGFRPELWTGSRQRPIKRLTRFGCYMAPMVVATRLNVLLAAGRA